MHDEPFAPIFVEGRIAAVGAAQMKDAVLAAITRLPYDVIVGAGEAIEASLRLTSGRLIDLTPQIVSTDDAIGLHVMFHGVVAQDHGEIQAIGKNLIQNATFNAAVLHARAAAAA